MKFELSEYHRNIPDEELINDLKRVALVAGKSKITVKEYNKIGKFSAQTLTARFGSWFKILEIAGLEKTRNLGLTEDDLLNNIEEVWRSLGRQPSYSEMVKPISKYSAKAYEYRFGSWRKSLEKFIAYIDTATEYSESLPKNEVLEFNGFKHKTKRAVGWRLSFLVMKRDAFTCRCCGRSPANTLGLILHVDHMVPWSKDGETTIENLQTLCEKCNIGKGDLLL